MRHCTIALVATVLAATAGAEAPPALDVQLADAVLARWPDPLTIAPEKGFEYTTGIVLRGIAEVYRATGDRCYLDYVQRWVDAYVHADGTIDFGENEHNFDRIQPGVLVLFLYEKTRLPRYEKAARTLRARFDTAPVGPAGGYWHKQKYPGEMWLDGLYMSEPFLVRYGRLFGDERFAGDTAVRQFSLVAEHTRDPESGLLRHAWDQDKNAAWADPASGRSPIVWDRALGWYMMALVDVLDAMPAGQAGRAGLIDTLRDQATRIIRHQDPETGLWYQVLDKEKQAGNWLDTSGSAMLVYALGRGAELGILDADSAAAARRGWRGLVARLGRDPEGHPVVNDAVEGMGVLRDYESYVDKKRLSQSPHGLCGMLLAASQMEKSRP